MNRKRKATAKKPSPASRVHAERRAVQMRLAALDQPGSIQERGGPTGDNTPTSEPMEVVQEAVAKDINLASREVLVARLRALEQAEARIQEGTYGRCDSCGRPIPEARLRAMPEAIRCVPCEERRGERVGVARRR